MIRRHPVWAGVLLLLVLLLAGGGVMAAVGQGELKPVERSQHQQVVVTVARRESLDQLVATLRQDRLIRSSLFFGIYARVRGLDGKLHPGKFVLDRGMAPSEEVSVLEGPAAVLPISVTVPDGLQAAQEAVLLQDRGLFSPASYLAQVETGDFAGVERPAGMPAGASWEGMAFGDTYQVSPKISARQFLGRQLADFDVKALPALEAGAAKVGLSPYQALVLASIVEAEASGKQDRGLVAGVFLNRLAKGMPLQSDVTVLYAMDVAGQAKAKFSTSFPSAYNTYLHAGLPPGPIDSPGLGAIEAVLQPIRSDYLYFISLPDGKMEFAVTAAQHQQQVEAAGLG